MQALKVGGVMKRGIIVLTLRKIIVIVPLGIGALVASKLDKPGIYNMGSVCYDRVTVGVTTIKEKESKSMPVGMIKQIHPSILRTKQATVLEESFEAEFPPLGWDTVMGPSSPGYEPAHWRQSDAGTYNHSGDHGALCPWGYNLDEWLITPPLDLSDYSNIFISFWWMSSWYWHVDPYDNGDLFVQVSVDGGITWDTLWTFGDSAMVVNSGGVWPWNSWTWYQATLNLSTYVGYDNVRIAFRVVANDNADIAIDDVVVYSIIGYDVGVVAINSPARYVQPGVTFTPSVTVQNFGATTVTFDVGFEIYDAEDNRIYSSTATVTNLECDETQEVTFAPNWTPPAEGNYTAVAYTMLVEDENTANDTMVVSFEVTAMWVDTLFYDDGTVANAGAWYYEGNGFGYKFTPGGGQYPIQVNGVLLYFYDGWPDPGGDQFRVMICDDDGPNGAPSTKVYVSPVISGATTGAWNYVDLSSQYIVFEDGSFYVFYIQVGDYPYCLGLCVDGEINSPYGAAWFYYADGDNFAIDDLSWIGGDWLLRAEITPYSPPTIDVWLPDTSGAHGDTVLLPVMASDLTGYGVYSVGMDITFDT
ncbi:hypothetical protein DRJ19_02005, partial [Candidatus Woesearchaeota archaeon]